MMKNLQTKYIVINSTYESSLWRWLSSDYEAQTFAAIPVVMWMLTLREERLFCAAKIHTFAWLKRGSSQRPTCEVVQKPTLKSSSSSQFAFRNVIEGL